MLENINRPRVPETSHNTFLKPSIQSLEGKSVAVVLLSCLAFLYDIIDGSPSSILEVAKATQESISPYLASDLGSTGKIGAVLFFMYKIIAKFTDSRTELKKKEIEEAYRSET